jgi:hypothetical protein
MTRRVVPKQKVLDPMGKHDDRGRLSDGGALDGFGHSKGHATGGPSTGVNILISH